MRVIVKGGVWKNTEDEILKAAVMKYGKNQWARISSLLVRKTPKQCKARWYEWLDPSIKKTEWAKEEDEKLLHLAKLMPTQWRTIAPIVGRTPAQCLERYQKLLDEAERDEAEGDEAGQAAGEDVRKLRPGELDTEPETRPARPDPIDMDEDEKEMLSEARARLANTQGKKAKRKAREKQLQEARRLTLLQKRRELKAAGIDFKVRRKRGFIDYNVDIPLYKPAPAGFHDTEPEKEREENEKDALQRKLLTRIDGKRKADQDSDEESSNKKQKSHNDKDKPKKLFASETVKALAAQRDYTQDRGALFLPPPQVGESELEEIVKVGHASDTAKLAAGSETPATALLGEYVAPLPIARTAMRTPRLSSKEDSLKVEARNLRLMEQSQTPLLGDQLDVEADRGTGYEGVTPRRSVAMTPRAFVGGSVAMTPRSVVSMTPRSEAGSVAAMSKQELNSLFKSLPKPKNDFEIIVPDVKSVKDDMEMDIDQDDTGVLNNERDMSDIVAEQRRAELEAEKRKLERRSTAVKRDLPRPLLVDVNKILNISEQEQDADMKAVNKLVKEEMARLLVRDATEYPYPGQAPPITASKINIDLNTDDDIEDKYLAMATELLQPNESLDEFHKAFADAYDHFHSQHTFIHGLNVYKNLSASELSDREKVGLLNKNFSFYRNTLGTESKKAMKLEKRLDTLLGGYRARSAKLGESLSTKYDELVNKSVAYESLNMLKSIEEGGASSRVEKLVEDVERVEKLEMSMQERYKELLTRKEELKANAVNGA